MKIQDQSSGSHHDARSVLIVLLALLAAYVCLYFTVLALPYEWRLPLLSEEIAPGSVLIETKFVEINGEMMADFHGIPRTFFGPIHWLDKNYLRYSHWFNPRNVELDFDWLHIGIQTPHSKP